MSIRFNGQLFSTHSGQTLSLREAAEWSDFAREHSIENTLTEAQLGNIDQTFALLRAAYTKLGCTAEITSFFRSADLNSHVGGMLKPPSAHMDGRAVDSVPQGVSVQEAYNILKELGEELQYDQLIIEHDKAGNIWLHLSVPDEGKKARKMAIMLEKGSQVNRAAKG